MLKSEKRSRGLHVVYRALPRYMPVIVLFYVVRLRSQRTIMTCKICSFDTQFEFNASDVPSGILYSMLPCQMRIEDSDFKWDTHAIV